ncbi:hypothetical protein CsSME_00040468 [Camellia sinensis var. sinensis]
MGPNMMHVEDFLENGLPLLVEDIQERVENASSNICEIEDLRYLYALTRSSHLKHFLWQLKKSLEDAGNLC